MRLYEPPAASDSPTYFAQSDGVTWQCNTMAGSRTSCASSLVVLRSVAPSHAVRSLVVNDASRFTRRSTSDHSSSTTRARTSRPCSVSAVASCCSH